MNTEKDTHSLNVYNGIIFPSLNRAKRTPVIGP